jgi:hypothetical protein
MQQACQPGIDNLLLLDNLQGCSGRSTSGEVLELLES